MVKWNKQNNFINEVRETVVQLSFKFAGHQWAEAAKDEGQNEPFQNRRRTDNYRTDVISNLFRLGELEDENSCFMKLAAPVLLKDQF